MFLDFAKQEYRESMSPQKIGHPRRSNSKYRIKKLISNSTVNEEEHRDTLAANKNKPQVRQHPYNPEQTDKPLAVAQKLK